MFVCAVGGGWGSWTTPEEAGSLSEQVLCAVRSLAAPQHVDPHQHRHLPLLFNLFHAYAALGYNEKQQLLRVSAELLIYSICAFLRGLFYKIFNFYCS